MEWIWAAGDLSFSIEQTLLWARSMQLHSWDSIATLCLMWDQVPNILSLKQPVWNNYFVWNMLDNLVLSGGRWFLCSLALCSVAKSLSCSLWNKFLHSAWSSPCCIFLKMKLNTGPYPAKNNCCSWYCLSSVRILCSEDITTILKGKISPFQQPRGRLLNIMITPTIRAVVLLSVIAEKVMLVYSVYFSQT